MSSYKTIVFANQKGGVGKTTLCALFANYLIRKGKSVVVVDADYQRSLSSQRQDESESDEFRTLEEPYNVYQFSLDSRENSDRLMDEMRKVEGYTLIDSPGALTDDGLIPLLTKADLVVVPFDYSNIILKSTATFIKVYKELSEKYGGHAKLVFVPNRIEKGAGYKEEREMWAEYDKLFASIGVLTPKIFKRYNFTRYNTFGISIEDAESVKGAFNCIIRELKNLD